MYTVEGSNWDKYLLLFLWPESYLIVVTKNVMFPQLIQNSQHKSFYFITYYNVHRIQTTVDESTLQKSNIRSGFRRINKIDIVPIMSLEIFTRSRFKKISYLK